MCEKLVPIHLACVELVLIPLKDTDLDTAAHATRASSVNNLTSYFSYTSVSARKNAKFFKLMSGK